MTTATSIPPRRRLSPRSMLSYGVGAVAYGVKDSGFGTFLLLFYNQVLGLPAATVGLVIMVALLVDAMIDPAVGFFSDRTHSRWGRRHPWMYASAVPIAIGWHYALAKICVWSRLAKNSKRKNQNRSKIKKLVGLTLSAHD